MREVFIFSKSHDECGSEKLSAYATESELIAAVQKFEGLRVKGPVELAEAFAEARKENGQDGVNPTNQMGWGGSHIFILSY
tara:strand:- start:889 stop:1131 length:243 start_codon:yes stop_codon:yes gene_type:complete